MAFKSSALVAADMLVIGVPIALPPATDPDGVVVDEASVDPFCLEACLAAFSANRFCLDAVRGGISGNF